MLPRDRICVLVPALRARSLLLVGLGALLGLAYVLADRRLTLRSASRV